MKHAPFLRAILGRLSSLLPQAGQTDLSRFARSIALLGCGCAILLISGCATVRLPSFTARQDDVTGTIAKPAPILSERLSDEDWRRAQAALGVAMDPQGNGLAVSWDNPDTGAEGEFTPLGVATTAGGLTCRPFHAELGGKLPKETHDGLACRDKISTWIITQINLDKSKK